MMPNRGNTVFPSLNASQAHNDTSETRPRAGTVRALPPNLPVNYSINSPHKPNLSVHRSGTPAKSKLMQYESSRTQRQLSSLHKRNRLHESDSVDDCPQPRQISRRTSRPSITRNAATSSGLPSRVRLLTRELNFSKDLRQI